MHVHFNIFGLNIPAYGLMITLGVVVANLVALYFIRKEGRKFDDIILIEAYCLLGAFVGAKLLYIIVSFNDIDWESAKTLEGVSNLMSSGFVFYGGLIGGIGMILLAGKIHGVESKYYLKNYIFAAPLGHAFGRIGCFCAGCCYGMEYHGPGAVVFPHGSFAPAGVELFPVQLVESACLFIIAGVMIFLKKRGKSAHLIEIYMIGYGIVRFVLEFFRDDAYRGVYFGISTSQWISMLAVAGGIVLWVINSRRNTSKESGLQS